MGFHPRTAAEELFALQIERKQMNATRLKKEITPQLAAAFKKAFRQNVILQAIVLFFAGLLLDGGFTARVCLLAAVAWWCAALIISVRRGSSPTKIDMLFMEAGYVLLIAISYFSSPLWGWLSF